MEDQLSIPATVPNLVGKSASEAKALATKSARTASGELSFYIIIGSTTTSLYRCPGSTDLALHELIMLFGLLLLANEVVHEVTHDLRGWPVYGLSGSHEALAQLGFKLQVGNGFFGHDRHLSVDS